MLEKFKNAKGKKGFTLVEVIVVLVILAILAALLVPKLVGWIDEANKKSAIADGHLILAASQTIATEQYAKGVTATDAIKTAIIADIGKYLTADDYKKGTVLPIDYVATENKITSFSYKSGKYTVNYANGTGFTVA